MKRETWSIVVACALGAFIGSLAALEIAARFKYGSYFWGVGALLGGAVAYVAVDFRHFCAGVSFAYRTTSAWRPNSLYWHALFASWMSYCSMMASVIVFVNLAFIGLGNVHDDLLRDVYYVWPGACLSICSWFAFMSVASEDKTTIGYEDRLRRMRKRAYKDALNWSPFGVVYWTLYGLVWMIIRAPRLIVDAVLTIAVLTADFAESVFVYVHSSRRTLCFVDAALCAAIGYAFGSAVIGAIAGALLGVISYELVSVRWLRLTSQTTR